MKQLTFNPLGCKGDLKRKKKVSVRAYASTEPLLATHFILFFLSNQDLVKPRGVTEPNGS